MDRPNTWFVKMDKRDIVSKYNLKRNSNAKDIIVKITDINNMTMDGVEQFPEVPLSLGSRCKLKQMRDYPQFEGAEGLIILDPFENAKEHEFQELLNVARHGKEDEYVNEMTTYTDS